MFFFSLSNWKLVAFNCRYGRPVAAVVNVVIVAADVDVNVDNVVVCFSAFELFFSNSCETKSQIIIAAAAARKKIRKHLFKNWKVNRPKKLF